MGIYDKAKSDLLKSVIKSMWWRALREDHRAKVLV